MNRAECGSCAAIALRLASLPNATTAPKPPRLGAPDSTSQCAAATEERSSGSSSISVAKNAETRRSSRSLTSTSHFAHNAKTAGTIATPIVVRLESTQTRPTGRARARGRPARSTKQSSASRHPSSSAMTASIRSRSTDPKSRSNAYSTQRCGYPVRALTSSSARMRGAKPASLQRAAAAEAAATMERTGFLTIASSLQGAMQRLPEVLRCGAAKGPCDVPSLVLAAFSDGGRGKRPRRNRRGYGLHSLGPAGADHADARAADVDLRQRDERKRHDRQRQHEQPV